MIYKIFPVVCFTLFSIFTSETNFNTNTKFKKLEIASVTISSFDSKVETIYNHLNSNQFNLPNLESFKEALKGYFDLGRF